MFDRILVPLDGSTRNVLPLDFYPEATPPLHPFGIVVALDGSERDLATLEPAAYLAAAIAAALALAP